MPFVNPQTFTKAMTDPIFQITDSTLININHNYKKTGTINLATKVNADNVITVRNIPSALHINGLELDAPRTAMGNLTNGSRLYLRGHGDWRARWVAGRHNKWRVY